jgi:hypothetical protein
MGFEVGNDGELVALQSDIELSGWQIKDLPGMIERVQFLVVNPPAPTSAAIPVESLIPKPGEQLNLGRLFAFEMGVGVKDLSGGQSGEITDQALVQGLKASLDQPLTLEEITNPSFESNLPILFFPFREPVFGLPDLAFDYDAEAGLLIEYDLGWQIRLPDEAARVLDEMLASIESTSG